MADRKDRQNGTGTTGQAQQDRQNNRQKIIGNTGLPEQVCQEKKKNAETGLPGQDTQDSYDWRDRQNRTVKAGLTGRAMQNSI
jgi:hypothetical protein